jgi:hypothetical protein
MWDLWLTKWHWVRFFPEFFGFPLSVSFHRRSIARKRTEKWTKVLIVSYNLSRFSRCFPCSLSLCLRFPHSSLICLSFNERRAIGGPSATLLQILEIWSLIEHPAYRGHNIYHASVVAPLLYDVGQMPLRLASNLYSFYPQNSVDDEPLC